MPLHQGQDTSRSLSPTIPRPGLRQWACECGDRLFPLRITIFLAILGIYLHAVVDMRLVFWNQNELFLWNSRFVRDFMLSPGQPGELLGNLLLQVCCYGWPGAIVVALLVWLVLVSARGLFSRIDPNTRAGDTWVIPAIVLFVLHSQYSYRLSATTGLALAMLGSHICVRASHRNPWAGLAVFVTASVLLYYVAAEAYYIFAACCLVHELLVARRPMMALYCLLTAASVKIGTDTVLSHVGMAYSATLEPSYLIPPYGTEHKVVSLLHFYFPACTLFIAIKPALLSPVRRLWQRGQPTRRCRSAGQAESNSQSDSPNSRHRDGPHVTDGQGSRKRWIRHWVVIPILISLAASAGVRLSRTSYNRKILAVDYYSNSRMWNAVLREARNVPRHLYRDFVSQDVSLALYHTGRLPYDMFSYPPSRLFADHRVGRRGRLHSRKAFDLYLELGRVNEAENVAHNALEKHMSAEFLMRIAMTKMVKRQIQAARVYLNVLSEDLSHGHWAKAYLQRLREDPVLADDLRIAEIRDRMIVEDDAHLVHGSSQGGSVSVSAERQLLSLLERNSHNRMAFEYLMAMHLMNRNLEAIVARLPQLHEFSYSETPTLYEEAVMLHAMGPTGQIAVSERRVVASGLHISEKTVNNCILLQDIDRFYHGLNSPMAREVAAQNLKSTYLFYYFYGPGQTQ